MPRRLNPRSLRPAPSRGGPGPERLIDCRELSFAYAGKIAVRPLTFSVCAGDRLCIVGENGSGKSTLVQGLLGLLAPHGGTIWRDAGLRGGDTGYLPQRTRAWNDFPAGVMEVTLSGFTARRGLRPWFSRQEKAEAEEQLTRLGLARLKGRCYRELSGGQQRRVLLARALCAARRLLVLDEADAGLDADAEGLLYSLLDERCAAGLSVIMVSHRLKEAAAFAGRILRLKQGEGTFLPAGAWPGSGA